MKLFLSLLVLCLLLLALSKTAFAVYDPLTVPNNKYGIHIVSPSDLKDAANLVNSMAGDWGYFTIVIQQTQRETATWQKVFDDARRLHLVPIVRIASRPQGDVWEKPSAGEIDGWISFLNSLNWVVKNRYVIIGNEPNHASEWGGEINPEEYANYLTEFSEKLKAASEDFFVLPAGFDASSSNSKSSMDEALYLKRMLAANPDLFANLDGWTSHSYPNPGFSGPADGTGRGSVRTFLWEKSLLENLGIEKELPIFITETGWTHPPLVPEEIGARLRQAFENAWQDNRIVAVTPFLLDYGSAPFDTFSWKDKEGNFYSFYQAVQALPKEKGQPLQDDKGRIQSIFVSPFHLANSIYTALAFLKNEGQAIWDKDKISFTSRDGVAYEVTTWSFASLEPGQTGFVVFKGRAPQTSGVQTAPIILSRNGVSISQPTFFQFITISPARMKLDAFFATIWRLFRGP